MFPDDFSKQLENFRNQLKQRGEKAAGNQEATIPNPVIFCNTANEKSQLAYTRLSSVLRSWADAIGKQNLKDSQLPAATARPFEFQREDVSEAQQRSAAMWSKILPFVLLLWALTGAFYPAIDLCAGEKERGTLETLLCSPAQRSEIVTGKLLTVMLFSMATSLLNLVSMGLTGAIVISHLPMPDAGVRLGLPPLLAQMWLVLALLPVAALVQCAVHRFGGFRAQHQRRPILFDAIAAGDAAAGDFADGPRHGTELGQQLDSAHRPGAAAQGFARRQLHGDAAVCRAGGGDYAAACA